MKVNKKQKIGIKDCKEIWEKHEKHLDNLETTKIITVSNKDWNNKQRMNTKSCNQRLLSHESSLCGDHLKTRKKHTVSNY